MLILDFHLLLFIAPALLLGIVAQVMVKSAYAAARRIPAGMSGYAAARRLLDSAGLRHVEIEQTPGYLSDHYDPRLKRLRLSGEVFHGRSMASVGIAAHEAGHAIQDATHYAPLAIRNAAVPAANFGSSAGILLMILGLAVAALRPLLLVGIVLFGCVVFFQLVNLPVEFNASARAKQQLVDMGIVPAQQMHYVNRVLNAAALTYVAATLQAVLTLLYFVLQVAGGQSRD